MSGYRADSIPSQDVERAFQILRDAQERTPDNPFYQRLIDASYSLLRDLLYGNDAALAHSRRVADEVEQAAAFDPSISW